MLSNDVLWKETYENTNVVNKKINHSWLLTADLGGYFDNIGDTDVTVNVLKDLPLGGQGIAYEQFTLAHGEHKTIQVRISDVIYNASNTMVMAKLYINCNNMDLEDFSIFCRCKLYE